MSGPYSQRTESVSSENPALYPSLFLTTGEKKSKSRTSALVSHKHSKNARYSLLVASKDYKREREKIEAVCCSLPKKNLSPSQTLFATPFSSCEVETPKVYGVSLNTPNSTGTAQRVMNFALSASSAKPWMTVSMLCSLR